MSLEKRRLPWQPPIQAKQAAKVVFTEEALRLAIGEVVAHNSDNITVAQGFGTEIIIGGPIQLKVPIVIPFNCPGLTISGNGFSTITANGTVSSVFEIHAPDVTLRNLLIYADVGVSSINVFSKIITIGAWIGGLAPNRLTVENCFFLADQFIDDNSFLLDYFVIDNCNFVLNSAPSATPMVRAQMRYWKITKCNWTNTAFLTTRANSEYNTIIGNYAAGAAIDTSVGNGFNTIVGNTQLVITATAGTDAVGFNT